MSIQVESNFAGAPVPLVEAARPARHAETQVIFKTTDRLEESEREQMRDLFLRVFNKSMTKDAFERKFLCTPKGYSYHSLMLHQGAVTGAMSAVPWRYKVFDEEWIFALSVDVMIDPAHRGGGHILKMTDLVHQGLIEDGVPFIFGFPNEQFYPVQKRLLRYEVIGELDYYALPLNIGAVARKLAWFRAGLDGLSRVACKYAVRSCRIPRDSRSQYNIAKVADAQFEQHRYDASYSRVTLTDGAVCTYKIWEEEGGVRTLYIIDVAPLTRASLARAVKQVFETALDAADLVIYVGKLPYKPAGLWKVPDSRKPRRIRMTGKVLIPGLVDASVLDIENWRVNLSDFDVR